MKKKQTFTEMLNGLIENGLIVTKYETPDPFESGGILTDIDVYIDESKFYHCELYMIPDDMIKLIKDIIITDFIFASKHFFQLFGETQSKEWINATINGLQNAISICRVYDIDPKELEDLKIRTKTLFDDIGSRLDNEIKER